jgi:tetratricopeptide (TPR) repeat protein
MNKSLFKFSFVSLPAGIFLFAYSVFYLKSQIDFQKFQSSLMYTEDYKKVEQALIITQENPLPALIIERMYFEFIVAMETHNYKHAKVLGEYLHENFPGFYESEQFLAYLYLQENQPDKALAMIEKAIDFHPKEERNYLVKSMVQKGLNRFDEAAKTMEQYHMLKTRNKNFRENLLK